MKTASGRADIKNVRAVAEIDISKIATKRIEIRAANNRQQINQILEGKYLLTTKENDYEYRLSVCSLG